MKDMKGHDDRKTARGCCLHATMCSSDKATTSDSFLKRCCSHKGMERHVKRRPSDMTAGPASDLCVPVLEQSQNSPLGFYLRLSTFGMLCLKQQSAEHHGQLWSCWLTGLQCSSRALQTPPLMLECSLSASQSSTYAHPFAASSEANDCVLERAAAQDCVRASSFHMTKITLVQADLHGHAGKAVLFCNDSARGTNKCNFKPVTPN